MTVVHERTRPHRQDVRERLLAAALLSFEANGYAGTSLAEVARAAGFTKGAIYSNFAGKPELFVAACQQHFDHAADDLAAPLGRLLAGRGAGAAPSGAIARALADVAVSSPWQLVLAEFRDVARTDPEAAQAYLALRERQVDRVSAVLAEHGLGEDDAHRDALAAILLGQLQQVALEVAVRTQRAGGSAQEHGRRQIEALVTAVLR